MTSPSSCHIYQQRMPGISQEMVTIEDPLHELLLESQKALNDVNDLIDLYESERLLDIYQNYKPLIPNYVLDNFPILTHDGSLTPDCFDVYTQIDRHLLTMDPFIRHTTHEENSKALTQAEKVPYLKDTLAIANQSIPNVRFNILYIIRSHDPGYVSPFVGDEVLTDKYKTSRNKNTINRQVMDYVLLHKIRDYIQKLITLLE